MNEVDQQSLDVRAVVVLICHDHYRTVPETLDVLILPADLDPKDLDKVLDLRVLHYLFVWGFSHIQKLSSEREDPVIVASNNFNPS